MDRKFEITLTGIFLFLIFSIGIVQAIAELKKGESVQFFDALEDTFLTPLHNRRSSADFYDSLIQKMVDNRVLLENIKDTAGDDEDGWSTVGEHTDDIIFSAGDLKKIVVNVNRHRSVNPQLRIITQLDSLITLLNSLYDNVQAQGAVTDLLTEHKKVTQYLQNLAPAFKRPGLLSYPILVVKHFFLYTIFNREYLRKYETELEETSVFANTLRPFMQFFRYTLLHDWGEKALEGKNRWLFYKQGVDYLIHPYILDKRSVVVDPEDTPIMDNAVDSIVAFRDELAKRDIEMMVVIAPGKASIYPDLLSSRKDPQKTAPENHSLKMMRDLNEQGIETVDLFSALTEARKRDTEFGDSLYLAQDTHWKTRGVQVAAKTVADHIRAKSWFAELGPNVEYTCEAKTIERDGDIRVMADLPDFKLPFFSMPFYKEKTTCLQVYQIRRGEDSTVVSKNLFRDDYRNSKILVLGDSFSRIYQSDKPGSAGWISHLAYELSLPVCSIVSDGGASTLVREKLERKKGVLKGRKLVVWEFVERDIRYGAEGWRDIKL